MAIENARIIEQLGRRYDAGFITDIESDSFPPGLSEDVVRACMGLEEQATAGHLRHSHDPLLDLHVRQPQQLPQGDGWRFARRREFSRHFSRVGVHR